ncbi:MAG: metallopeptidase TldD-related protein [Acidimicrobiales bacterium]
MAPRSPQPGRWPRLRSPRDRHDPWVDRRNTERRSHRIKDVRLVDRLGERVASPLLTLVDDATNPRSLGADSHDGEGLACRPTTLIKDGVLNAFLFDSYTGRKANRPSTGSAHRAITRVAVSRHARHGSVRATGILDDLIAEVDDGVLVFSMKGLHSGVNPVSGDFSVGIDGIRIRNGVLSEPISECTAASTLQKILLSIRSLGSDAKPLANGAIVPSMIVDDVMLSGDNDASR